MGAVKGGWILLIPNSDPAQHRATIKSEKYEGTMVFTPTVDKAVEVCQELIQKDGLNFLTLCPAFTHEDVAKIAASVRGTPINVCRGDGPGLLKEFQDMKNAGWF